MTEISQKPGTSRVPRTDGQGKEITSPAHGKLSRRTALRGAGVGATSFLIVRSLSPLSYAQAAASPSAIDAAIAYAQAHLPNSNAQIIKAAAKEGSLALTLQALGDDAYQAMIKKFNERYPFIRVSFTSQGAVPLLGKFNAENASHRGIGDCFLLSSPHDGDVSRQNGAVSQFKISQDSAFPAAAKSSGYWYGWQLEFATTVFRLGALSSEELRLIRSYQGLADPRFKGRLGAANVTTGTSAAQCYHLLHHTDQRVWKGLAANKPMIKPGSPLLLDGLLRGEYDVALFMGESTAANAARGGAPVGFVISSPAVTGYVTSVIAAAAPHPNAAKLWQDWALSKEGQDLWPTVSAAYSARTDVKTGPWYAAQPWFYNGSHVEIDWNDFSAQKNNVIAQFNAAFK